MTQVFIPIGASRQLPIDGTFLFLKSATGPVMVSVVGLDGNRSTYPMMGREQFRFPGGMKTLEILNTHAADNTLEILNGFAEFLPNNDGQKVTLTGQDLSIEVVTMPGAPLEMESTNAKPVRVINKTGTQIAVSGDFLTDAQLRAVPVDVQPVIYSTATPGAEITGSGSVPVNAARRHLILMTDAANTGFYWTGAAAGSGLKLGAGKTLTLETSAALTLTATVGGDKISFLQIEA
jgi:hypothetical protein